MEKNFGTSLVAKRKRAGFSQKQLADKLGVTTKTVIDWEKGRVIPHGANSTKLHDVLNEKVTTKGNMNTPPEEELFRKMLQVLEATVTQNGRTLDQTESQMKKYEAMADGRIIGLEKDKDRLNATNDALSHQLVEQNHKLLELLSTHIKPANKA